MRDLRQFITKNQKYKPVKFENNYPLNFFAYCVYNSFKVQPDVSGSLNRMINEENDYFVLSWDAYDQAHIWDFMYADCDEQHWIRKIVLDCMLQGDYEINQYSQYIEAVEERDEAVEEIIEMMQDNHLTKKEQVAVKKFYDKEFYEQCRMFAIVIKSYALEKIYSHKELRSLFESATQLRFQNKNTVFEAFLIDEQI